MVFTIREMRLKLLSILILYVLFSVPCCTLTSLQYKKNCLLFSVCPAGGWNPLSVRSRWCMTTWQLWAIQTLYECSKKQPTQTSAVWFASTAVSSHWAALTIIPSLQRPTALTVIWLDSSENRPCGLKTDCCRFLNIFHPVFIRLHVCARVCALKGWNTLHHVIPFISLRATTHSVTVFWHSFDLSSNLARCTEDWARFVQQCCDHGGYRIITHTMSLHAFTSFKTDEIDFNCTEVLKDVAEWLWKQICSRLHV